MKIKTLKLENFRCFKTFELDFDHCLTVLVSENGGGKTTILDAIATGLGPFLTRLPGVSGMSPKKSDHRLDAGGKKAPYMRIGVEATNGVCWDRTEKRDQSAATSREIPPGLGPKPLREYADTFIDAHNADRSFQLPVIAYYGTGRGVFDVPQRRRDFKKEFLRFEALDGALGAKTNFKRFFEYFYFLEELERRGQKSRRDFDFQQPELKTIRLAVEKAMPEFSNLRSEVRPLRFLVDWKINCESRTLRIEQLSDGYRTTLALIMDIAARMAEANPEMADPLAAEGIVLIDEVDMHLHPRWQQTILSQLQRAFKNLQFIVTTHSPQVLSTVPAQCIRGIRWKEDQPYVYLPDFALGAEPQQLLDDILGVIPRPQGVPIVKDLNRYLEMIGDDEWDTPEAVSLREKLDEWGLAHDPILLRADMDIRLRERRRSKK